MGIDLILASGGDLPKVSLLGTGLVEIAQRIQIRLNTQTGGWPLDPTKGIDYQAMQQQREVDVRAIGAILKAEIETTPGVQVVLDWEGSFDVAQRLLSYSGRVVTEEGEMDLVASAVPAASGNSAAALTVMLFSSGAIVGGA